LEGYFSCPFRNFVERGLRLEEREETAVLAVDTGNFIHELLETTTKQMSNIQTEEEMQRVAQETAITLMQSPIYAAQADTASGEFFSKRLIKEGTDVVLAAYRQLKYSNFVVEETEKNISTPTIHGKVDRVDGTDKFVRIIDYKTGKIDESATSYYTGTKLQMQLYMSALKGERIPAGVFYFPASVDYADTDEGRFKMKGFLNGDAEALQCGDTTLTAEGMASEFFPAKLGDNKASKRVMDEQTFRDFLDYSVLVARQGCQEIKEGNVAPSPYKDGCKYCKYGGMCGFRAEKDAARSENTIDPPTIAEIARKARDGEEA
jgi:ATP-dependent helicase/nuclease subunit B